jgi:hypothetical protein
VVTWIKIEFYVFIMSILPHLITLAIWVAIAVALYWAVTLI